MLKIDNKIEISGDILARNTLLNLFGQALPLAVGIVTIPFIIRGLGTARFGLLSLAWIILGYFSIFDLGLGRATTKYVAEALGKGEQGQLRRIFWTAVTVQVVLGVLGSLILVGIAPVLVDHILNIPTELSAEAKATFYLLAIAIPVVLASSSFRGVFEAAQRFDLVNAVMIPSSILTYILALVGLLLDFYLPGIVALILAARIGALATLIVMNFRVAPQLKVYSGSFGVFPRLLAFGGWATVTSIVGPILVYLDRFLIGSLLSMAAVAFYSAPYETVTRLSLIASSLTMTLFPAFSSLEGAGNSEKLGSFFARSIKYILLVLGPCILVIGLFAKDILQMWLGPEFAKESTRVFQILALGVLVNSLAQIPFALLQGVGRPDIPAKFHLLELPIYIGIAWLLVSQRGIIGAATAWTLRVVLDALLLFLFAFKVCKLSPRLLAINGLTLASLVFLLLTGIAYCLKSLAGHLPLFIQSFLFVALFALFGWVVWRNVLDDLDRGTAFRMVKLWKKSESTL